MDARNRIVFRNPVLKMLFFLLFLASSDVMAGEKVRKDSVKTGVYQGFSGGMMLHTGYLLGINPNAPIDVSGRSYSPQGTIFGIGGSLRVHLWQHLRTGFEGFVSTMPSNLMDNKDLLKDGSFVRIGCGGILADAYWRMGKAWPYVGATIGGGAMRSLYMIDGDESSWKKQNDTYFHKESFFYVTPYVGCDYCLTPRVHLTFRFDWMLAVHRNTLVLPTGPRIYFGFMFTH